ncbi:hypothetical protein [Falsiroseomonas sp. E2-1-a20]|uniref:hypothetical protein n=1 Tax=Falsiroseomonas sp. E2-1-a20 TaxID=3239300 RepID=UPI003F35F3CB
MAIPDEGGNECRWGLNIWLDRQYVAKATDDARAAASGLAIQAATRHINRVIVVRFGLLFLAHP